LPLGEGSKGQHASVLFKCRHRVCECELETYIDHYDAEKDCPACLDARQKGEQQERKEVHQNAQQALEIKDRKLVENLLQAAESESVQQMAGRWLAEHPAAAEAQSRQDKRRRVA
jgi:hypothetical protein